VSPLSDGEAMAPAVRADDRTALVDDRARPERVRADAGRDEAGGVAARNEADLHAVRLVGAGQAEPARFGPDLVLRGVADGEQRARELLGPEREEKVGLVLRRVARGAEHRPA